VQARILGDIRARGVPVCVSGDGQYDSPGFLAAYCFDR
jgi:hypothetical protein